MDGDRGYDDYYDELDESILETLLILGLAGALAGLVWWRNQAAERARRNREQQQNQQQQQQQGIQGVGEGGAPEGGLFPPPDDPNFNAWVVGGVGH